MERSLDYAQALSNLDSAYNATSHILHHSNNYIPMSSSLSYRNPTVSPPPTSKSINFNFDLYTPKEQCRRSMDYPTPSSSVIVHHRPVHSPAPSQAISKLRQINNELSDTLAQCDLTTRSQLVPLVSPAHFHVHHYPIPHEHFHVPLSNTRSVSSSSSSSSSVEFEPVKRKSNARITFKAHIPRRSNFVPNADQILMSTSDAYSQNDPMTVDIYPTRDQGFVRRIRDRHDNQSPWLDDPSPVRRNSFSEPSTFRTPRSINYDMRPIQPNNRLTNGKVRARSVSMSRRSRPVSASSPSRRSTVTFSNTAPVWRPSGSIKRSKFIGSHAPPTKPKPSHEPPWNPTNTKIERKNFRAFDPTSKPLGPKVPEPVWQPASKLAPTKHPKYFEPTVKPALAASTQIESRPSSQTKKTKVKRKPSTTNPEHKTRIANAESKVKSAWKSAAPAKERKPPAPKPPKIAATEPMKPKPKIAQTQPKPPPKKVAPIPVTDMDTGRSSLNNVPSSKPQYQSTPKDQSTVKEENQSIDSMFDDKSQKSQRSDKNDIRRQPPREETPTKSVPSAGSNKKTDSSMRDDADSMKSEEKTPPSRERKNQRDEELSKDSFRPLSKPSEKRTSTPKIDNRNQNDGSSADHEVSMINNQNRKDDSDEDAEDNFERDVSRERKDKATSEASKQKNVTPPAKATVAQTTTPPPVEDESMAESERSNENSSEARTSLKKKEETPSKTSLTQPAAEDDAEDFFN